MNYCFKLQVLLTGCQRFYYLWVGMNDSRWGCIRPAGRDPINSSQNSKAERTGEVIYTSELRFVNETRKKNNILRFVSLKLQKKQNKNMQMASTLWTLKIFSLKFNWFQHQDGCRYIVGPVLAPHTVLTMAADSRVISPIQRNWFGPDLAHMLSSHSAHIKLK